MLSKYYHYISDGIDKADTFDVSALNQKIRELYSKDITIEKKHPGGTLGVFFQMIIDGKRGLLKRIQTVKCTAVI